MPRPKLYPLTHAQIEAAIAAIIETGQHHDGKKAATPKPGYFKNFKFESSEEGGTSVVSDRNEKFRMRCARHDFSFVTTTRALFNTSGQFKQTTCPFCEREAGCGRGFVTLAELAQQMASTDEFDWALDHDALAEDEWRANRILGTSESLPLLCKRQAWMSRDPCGSRVQHSVNNILTSLRGRHRHLVCQGACDSRSRGKSSRVSLTAFQQRLRESRGGEWTLSNPSTFRKISEPQWFTHTVCGYEIQRSPWHILGYRSDAGEAADCPYCSRASILGCVSESVPHFKRWVDCLTEGAVSYDGSDFPRTSDDLLKFRCSCGNGFLEKVRNLHRYEHYGCVACRNASLKSKRAWALEDAREIVARRGLELKNDPDSYIEAADIVATDGTAAPYRTILALVRAFPIRAHGVVVPAQAVLPSEPAGHKDKRRYKVDDRAFARLTPESCYWAGLLAADATISDAGEIVLELKAVDELVLQALASFVKFSGSCHYRTVKNVNGRGIYCSIRFRSRQICEDLYANFGMGPRKSRNLPRPSIPDGQLSQAYMAGLFEGDGHVRATRRGLVVHFVSASEQCFNWFAKQANGITAVTVKPRALPREEGTIFNLTYCDGAAWKLIASLHAAHPGHMQRKWKLLPGND